MKTSAGEEIRVQKGTQQIDGYWATLPRAVGKKAMNTGASGEPERKWLCKLLRARCLPLKVRA